MLSCTSGSPSGVRASDAESDGADPGVKVRRRISFESANLIGSPQDDVNFTGNFKGNAKSGVKITVRIESEG